VNTATDPMHCGSCTTACPMFATCNMGACACPAGAMLCGSTCAFTNFDPMNCGMCGHACAMGQTCNRGTCR
jgi:hypothetical protein